MDFFTNRAKAHNSTKGTHTMKNPSKFKLARAKRTMIGRVLCRLFGDQSGQTMMEYVVIGVLIVAAAVAVVLILGKNIRNQGGVMAKAVVGDAEGAKKMASDNYKKTDDEVKTAIDDGNETAHTTE